MICEECGKESHKEDVCVHCGLVVLDRPIQKKPPRRTQNQDYEKANEFEKVLAPHLMFSIKTNLNECKNSNLKRALKMNRHSNEYTFEGVYVIVFQEINRIAHALQLPKPIVLDVRLLFRNILQTIPNFLVRFKTQSSIAACFFVIFQLHGYVIDKKKVFELLRTSYSPSVVEGLVLKAYRTILTVYKIPSKNTDFPEYIDHIGQKLDSQQYWITHIHKFYNKIKHFFECQYNIKGYILAIFAYFGVSEKLLAELFEISEGTIKKRLKEIRRFVE